MLFWTIVGLLLVLVWFALTHPSIMGSFAKLHHIVTAKKSRENPVFHAMNPLKSQSCYKATAVRFIWGAACVLVFRFLMKTLTPRWDRSSLKSDRGMERHSKPRESRWISVCALAVHAKCFKTVSIAFMTTSLSLSLLVFFPSGDPFLCPSQHQFSHSFLLLVLLLSFKLNSWAGQLI